MSTRHLLIEPPIAKKVEYKREIHGKTLIDNYHWIKDITRKNTEVLKIIEAENKYTEVVLKSSKKLKKDIFQEMLERYKTESEKENDAKKEKENSYSKIGEWFYYQKKENDDRYYQYYRKKEKDETEELIIDLNEFSKLYEYFKIYDSIPGINYSPDRNYLAITVDLPSLTVALVIKMV